MDKTFDKFGISAESRNLSTYIAMLLESGARTYAVEECQRNNIPTVISGEMSHFKSLYSNRIYQIADLLRDQKRELICAILEMREVPSKIAYNDPTLVCPSILAHERDEIELRRRQKVEQKTSKAFICRKCGKNETTLQELQTRSSDEAPTLIIQCISCGYHWAQSG